MPRLSNRSRIPGFNFTPPSRLDGIFPRQEKSLNKAAVQILSVDRQILLHGTPKSVQIHFMGRPKLKRPTDVEVEILCALWPLGAATLLDIHNSISPERRIAYSSIATMVRIMVEKKMLKVVQPRRPQKVVPLITEPQAYKLVVDEWLLRLFGGSIVELLRHVLAGRKLSRAEVTELKNLIDATAKRVAD